MFLLPLCIRQRLDPIIFHLGPDADRRQVRTIQCKLELLATAAS